MIVKKNIYALIVSSMIIGACGLLLAIPSPTREDDKPAVLESAHEIAVHKEEITSDKITSDNSEDVLKRKLQAYEQLLLLNENYDRKSNRDVNVTDPSVLIRLEETKEKRALFDRFNQELNDKSRPADILLREFEEAAREVAAKYAVNQN